MKFVMGEEEEENKTTTNNTNKKASIRHHVKRRSSSRVTVTKLGLMTRTNNTLDSDEEVEPKIKKSQSQKTLDRLNTIKKINLNNKNQLNNSINMNPASLSSTVIAEPIENIINAEANNLVITKSTNKKKESLYSNFLNSFEENKQSRTQQKQQALSEDKNSLIHPNNIHKLNKEFDLVGREYKSIKKYNDPMLSSLVRCLEKLQPKTRPHLTTNQFSLSSPAVMSLTRLPINSKYSNLDQFYVSHRHNHLKNIALSRASKQLSNDNLFTAFPRHASALLDKLFS